MPYTIRNIIFSFFGVFSALIAAAPSFAVPLTVSYEATIGFDPTATVGTGGENAQTLIDELFGTGIGSAGSASVTGSFTWETDTTALNSNNRGAGYTNAITAASLSWEGKTTEADIDEIAANAGTSDFGYNTNDFNGFCGSRETCAALGQPFTATGNLLQTGNDTDFFLIQNGVRVDFSNRDFISFAIGRTDSDQEFTPSIMTNTFGEVSVDGVSLLFISTLAAALTDSIAIPTNTSFLTSDEVDTSIFTLTFNNQTLLDDFTLEGNLIDFVITNPTTSVPLPSSVLLLLAGIGGIRLARRR